MTEKNAFRAMAVAGIVFAVIFALSIFALGGDTPGEKASADEVVSSYQDDKNQHLIAVFLLVAAVVFLPFFAAALKEPFRGAGRAAEALAGVAFAGSVVCVAGILGMIVIHFALVSAADNGQAAVAQTLNVLDNDNFFLLMSGISILTLGAGLAILKDPVLPRWIGWISVVVGIAAVAGPLGIAAFFLFPLWIIVVSVLLLRLPALPEAIPMRA